jgi:hypothetical protein
MAPTEPSGENRKFRDSTIWIRLAQAARRSAQARKVRIARTARQPADLAARAAPRRMSSAAGQLTGHPSSWRQGEAGTSAPLWLGRCLRLVLTRHPDYGYHSDHNDDASPVYGDVLDQDPRATLHAQQGTPITRRAASQAHLRMATGSTFGFPRYRVQVAGSPCGRASRSQIRRGVAAE